MTEDTSIEVFRCLILVMKICNPIRLFISIIIFLITSFCNAETLALQKGSLEYLENRFDYSQLNPIELNEEGDIYFEQALAAEGKRSREKLFRYAMAKYFLTSKADEKNVYAFVQMGRIYDNMDKDRYAKESFYRATNLDYRNPYANFYFGEYYFKRRDYNRALTYYLRSYQNGFENNFDLNFRLAVIYEKLGDLVNSKTFYNKSYEMNPEKAEEYQQKLQQIDGLNYDKSEYYYIIRE